jgi:hypothetical protein
MKINITSMKEILKNIKWWLIFWFSAIIIMFIWWFVYATLTWTWQNPDNLEVNVWQTLTASWRNQTQLNAKLLEQRVSILEWDPENITNYSTGEIQTNAVWINGRPIYKKTFSFSGLQTLWTYTDATNPYEENMPNMIVKYEIIVSYTQNTTYGPSSAAYITYNDYRNIRLSYSGQKGDFRSMYITLWYYK